MILEKIRQLYPQLTKSQRKLADFIVTNYQEAAFMTASKLAHRLHINEATVIRFAQRLDYAGYPELIASIQEIVRRELAVEGQSLETLGGDDPFTRILATEDESLRRAISHLLPDVAHDMLAALLEANKIYLLGQGVAMHLASILSLRLQAGGFSAELVPGDAPGLATALSRVCADDLVIGFCFEEPDIEVASAIKYAKQAGARTAAFAYSSVSHVAQAADLAIICAVDSLFAVPSITVMAAFMDTFLQWLVAEEPERSRERRERIQRAQKAIRDRG